MRVERHAWGLVMGVMVVVSVGCGDGEAATDDAGLDAAVGGGTLIRAAEGGTVTSDDGVFRIIVPPGALAEDTVIRTRRMDDDASWRALFRMPHEGSAFYEVEPDGLSFSSPATAEFRYATAPSWALDAEGGLRVPHEWSIDAARTTATLSRTIHVELDPLGPYVIRAAVDHLSTHFVAVDRYSALLVFFGEEHQALGAEWTGRAEVVTRAGGVANEQLGLTVYDGPRGHATAISADSVGSGVSRTPPPNPTVTWSDSDARAFVTWRCDSTGVDELRVDLEYSADITVAGYIVEAFNGLAPSGPIGRYSVAGTLRSRVECGQLENGDTCSAPTSCASGFCVEGVCCDTECTGICVACDVAGSVGTCSPVPRLFADEACPPASACDGAGECRLVDGQPCASLDECLSGFCADGVCCDAACDGTCERCSTASATAGVCIPVRAGMSDPGTCDAPRVCDDAGACVDRPPGANGTACTIGAECSSGACVDGVCCASSSCAACRSCDVAGSEGSCTLLPAGSSDGADCPSPRTCSASGTCSRLPNGAPCTVGTECASTFCTDGVCCNYACFRECESCLAATSRAGVDGVCGPIREDTDPDDECPLLQTCQSYSADPTRAASCSAHFGDPCTATSPDCYNAGFCREGVCCNLASCGTTAPCTACRMEHTGMPDGTCAAVLPRTDPHDQCSVAGSVCDADQTCCLLPGYTCVLPSDCCTGTCNAARICEG